VKLAKLPEGVFVLAYKRAPIGRGMDSLGAPPSAPLGRTDAARDGGERAGGGHDDAAVVRARASTALPSDVLAVTRLPPVLTEVKIPRRSKITPSGSRPEVMEVT
jgi:hypothetical protein